MKLAITIVVSAILMEVVAWLMHKYIMHGPFWHLHEDHHVKKNHNTFFEKNDYFFVFFAIISISCFTIWTFTLWQIPLGMGIGVFIYGATYFIIHDLFIHQRIKIWRNTNNRYLKAIRRAHKMHHKHLDKQEGECFGMLWVPLKYYRDEYSKK